MALSSLGTGRLVADIGGTNARFALQYSGERAAEAVVLRCAEHEDIASAARVALAQTGAVAPPRNAVFGSDRVEFINGAGDRWHRGADHDRIGGSPGTEAAT